jgi:hypothetical protein
MGLVVARWGLFCPYCKERVSGGYLPPGEAYLFLYKAAHVLGFLPSCCHGEGVQFLRALGEVHLGQDRKRSLDPGENPKWWRTRSGQVCT